MTDAFISVVGTSRGRAPSWLDQALARARTVDPDVEACDDDELDVTLLLAERHGRAVQALFPGSTLDPPDIEHRGPGEVRITRLVLPRPNA